MNRYGVMLSLALLFSAAYPAADDKSKEVNAKLRPFLLGTDVLNCSPKFDRCVVPIYVLPDQTLGGVFYDCVAYVPFKEIYAPRSGAGKIRIVWVLVKGSLSDGDKYRFKDPGIVITTAFSEEDFDSPGNDADDTEGNETPVKRRFKWRSVNAGQAGTSKPFDYEPMAERKKGVNWVPCKGVDPRIVNQG